MSFQRLSTRSPHRSSSGQASSGYLVATSRCRVLLDCGPGVAAALSAHGGAGGLDAVVVTHQPPWTQAPVVIMRLVLLGRH